MCLSHFDRVCASNSQSQFLTVAEGKLLAFFSICGVVHEEEVGAQTIK